MPHRSRGSVGRPCPGNNQGAETQLEPNRRQSHSHSRSTRRSDSVCASTKGAGSEQKTCGGSWFRARKIPRTRNGRARRDRCAGPPGSSGMRVLGRFVFRGDGTAVAIWFWRPGDRSNKLTLLAHVKMRSRCKVYLALKSRFVPWIVFAVVGACPAVMPNPTPQIMRSTFSLLWLRRVLRSMPSEDLVRDTRTLTPAAQVNQASIAEQIAIVRRYSQSKESKTLQSSYFLGMPHFVTQYVYCVARWLSVTRWVHFLRPPLEEYSNGAPVTKVCQITNRSPSIGVNIPNPT